MDWDQDDEECVVPKICKSKDHPALDVHPGGSASAAVEAPLCWKTPQERTNHAETCKDRRCCWCMAERYIQKHKDAFPVVGEDHIKSVQYGMLSSKQKVLANGTWLKVGHRGEAVVVGCVVCHSVKDMRIMTNPFASFNIPATRFQVRTGRPHVLMKRASTDVRSLRAGVHLAAGIEGVGKYKKCNQVAWCLYATLRRSAANFLLDTAQTIWLARDVRKQRLLIRFRAVGFKGGEIVSRVGVLGQ